MSEVAAAARPQTAIGPDAYAAWRASELGKITEALEQRLVLDLLQPLAGARLLDVGCGDGALLAAAIAAGVIGSGVDRDAAMLTAAQARMDTSGARAALVEADIEHLPFADASFDAVVAITVLCFVPDACSAVRELVRVLRPGGRLVTGELGRWSVWAARRRMAGWLGSRIWKSTRFRTARELRRLVEGAGLTVDTVRGAVFYPPIGTLARLLAPADPWIGSRTTVGAAFIALSATKGPPAGNRS